MPYEPVRTQIQMAPLNMLPGVRLHTSRLRDRIVSSRGMGQAAICPSLEQLMGITDPNDPCQGGTSVVTGAPGVAPSVVSSAPSVSSFLSQNSGLLLGGVGLLFVLAIIKGAK